MASPQLLAKPTRTPTPITRLDHSEKRRRFAEKIELTRKIVTD
jgi:hypothetical protein